MRRPRDYAHKRFTRPRRRLSRGMGRAAGMAAFLTLLLVGLLNLPTVVTQLPIQSISVTGARVISAEQVAQFITAQIKERRWAVFPQRLAVFFSPRQTEAKLREHFPFASWSVKRNWLGGISVNVQERDPRLVWVSASGAWYLDDDGVAFTSVPAAPGIPTASEKALAIKRLQPLDHALPVVVDESGAPVPSNQPVITAATLAFIREVAKFLEAAGPWSTSVTRFRYHPRAYKLTAETADNLEIYFASDQPLAEQLAKLQTVITQGIHKRPGLRYVDVRFGQKVFYQ